MDAQLALAALAVMPAPGARAGAAALISSSQIGYGLRRVDDLVTAWLRARALGE